MDKTAPPGVPATYAAHLGEITWLLMQSPTHRFLFLNDLEWFVGAPLLLGQYKIFHDAGRPVAVALWAFVAPETDARLRAGLQRLAPAEWRATGPDGVLAADAAAWLVDVVTLPGRADAFAVPIIDDLRRTALRGRRIILRRAEASAVTELEPLGPPPEPERLAVQAELVT